ncbi:hypothetical protein [Aeromicrobium yanjiei]|uniref:Uncharacterized protein n=1 Tax=Aeromicrobium yanjiei TaxID=2662028 RepID=A0A5Q2MN16_9ACTN|nr:hypothetical protein [Aeromicrobium yanjiei]QGG41360.1 hypothetical protein GEV26_08290 [Aeromicrobium yanjiei]
MHSGIAVTDSGEVVVASPEGDAMVFLDRDGAELRRVATPTTDLHGIVRDVIDGRDVFWLVDHGHKYVPASPAYVDHRVQGRLVAVTPDGDVVHELHAPAHPAYAHTGWSPTALAVEGEDGRIWVADGYGASLVHAYAPDGSWLMTVDGADSGTAFDCPHGIVVDQRGPEPVLVVADRANQRLVELGLDGRTRRVLAADQVWSPSGLAIDDDLLLVTELWGDLVVLDRDGAVVDRVAEQPAEPERPGWPNAMADGAMVRPDVRPGALNSPHGVAVDPTDRSWVLTEWFIGGRVVRLSPRRTGAGGTG